MDALTWFGLFAVCAMLVSYALEERGHWFILGFAGACCLGSIYGFLQGAWPFGLVEAIWSLVAPRRWAVSGAKAGALPAIGEGAVAPLFADDPGGEMGTHRSRETLPPICDGMPHLV